MDRRAHLPRWVPQRPIWNRDAKWLRTSVTKCCGNRPGGASNHHRQVTAQWKLSLYVIAPPFASGIRMPQRLDWRQGGRRARLRDRLDALRPSPYRASPRPAAPRFRSRRPHRRVLGASSDADLRRPPDRLRGGPNAQSGARRDAAGSALRSPDNESARREHGEPAVEPPVNWLASLVPRIADCHATPSRRTLDPA